MIFCFKRLECVFSDRKISIEDSAGDFLDVKDNNKLQLLFRSLKAPLLFDNHLLRIIIANFYVVLLEKRSNSQIKEFKKHPATRVDFLSIKKVITQLKRGLKFRSNVATIK